jgi:glycosyltransferase involved in cell wall biosynthesis
MMRWPDDHPYSVAKRRKQKPWDVLALIGSLNVGGCERHLAMVYPQLKARGYDVGILTFARGGPLEQQVRAAGVDVMCINRQESRPARRAERWAGRATTFFDFVRVFRPQNARLVHFYLPGAYIIGGLTSLVARQPNVVMSRRSLNNYQIGHPVAAQVERFLHRRMRILTANASASLSELIEEGAPPERTILVQNGVDTDPFDSAPARRDARERLALNQDTLALAIVANLIPYKGHADLIEALGAIAGQIERDWVLLVAGRDDGLGQALAKRANELGLSRHIRWLGPISDVPALLRASDIAVLASHEEGSPNALLEYLTAGLAAASTRVGGVTDIVTDEVDALLVPPRDPAALGMAILRLMQDETLRNRLASAGARRVRDAFSLNACVDAYSHLYDLMLEQPALPPDEIARRYRMARPSTSGNAMPAPLSTKGGLDEACRAWQAVINRDS